MYLIEHSNNNLSVISAAVLLLIHCSQDLYDAQPGVPLVLESHHGVLQDLEASAGQLGDHLLLLEII